MPNWLSRLFKKPGAPTPEDLQRLNNIREIMAYSAAEWFVPDGPEGDQWERLKDRDPDLAVTFRDWLYRRSTLHTRLFAEPDAEYHYWEMVRKYAADSPFWYAIVPIFAYPLLLRAKRMVEFGSAFTFYPDTFEDPWGISSAPDEGMISTRILLAACKVLETRGIASKLVSIEIRGKAIHNDVDITNNGDMLFTELGLRQYWQPVFGMDSSTWIEEQRSLVRRRKELPIDFALLDSNHTYALTRAELEGLAAVMSDQGVMIIDNCYTLFYEVDAKWSPNESPEGIRKGGKFGAILEFAASRPDWELMWFPYPTEIACLRKRPRK
jgi:hypothetical protein